MKKTYTRNSTGSKKIAHVNMRKEEHQFVIDGYLIDETLKQIPDGINIIQAGVCIYRIGTKHKIMVPNVLKKLGIQSMREHGIAKEVIFVFDSIHKTSLVRNLKEACKKVELPYEKAYFKYIVLGNKEATGRFDHCTKEVKPDETDLRKKLRVLGCVSGTGKIQSLLADLGAHKYECRIKEEPVKFVMCSKV